MLSRLMTRKEQWVLLAFAGAIVLGAATLLFLSPHGQVAAPVPEVQPATRVVVAPVDPAVPPPPREAKEEEAAIEPEPVTLDPAPEQPLAIAQPPAPEPRQAVAGVVGEVAEPGVYTLDQDARLKDLVKMAGGATEAADLSDINLAARVIDGTTLTIPARREAAGASKTLRLNGRQRAVNPPQYTISGWQAAQAPATQPEPQELSQAQPAWGETSTPEAQSGGLIDLNTATQEQLETLPGIGPKLAGQILEYRESSRFLSVDDLTNVSGIGPKKLEALRPLVTVR